VPPQTQTGCGRTPSLQPKDEEALALQFGPDDVFFLSLNLSIEGRAIRTGHSVSKYRHDNYSGVQAEGSGHRLKAFRLKAGSSEHFSLNTFSL
jgi:hypothetical protein